MGVKSFVMSCCRATPKEYLAEKLLDIESLANYQLGLLEAKKLLYLRDPGADFDVFDRSSGIKIGTLFFEKENYIEYSVWLRTEEGDQELCRVDARKSSEKIGFKIAHSLAQL